MGAVTKSTLPLTWSAVPDAKAYVIHYVDKDTTVPTEMTFMGYSETPSWTLTDATNLAPLAGKKFTLAVQAFDQVGVGATPVAKAQYLNSNPSITSSAWSTPLIKATIPTV